MGANSYFWRSYKGETGREAFWFPPSWKDMVAILMMPAKLVTLGRLEIKLFWNKVYDVIISVHDVTNNVFSQDVNYIVDVVMWPKFGNYSISIEEVIKTLIF